MKKIIFLTLILIAAVSSFCQVNFENLPFDVALQKSKQTGKFIFLQFESNGCNQCNEVADKAFENKKLSETLEQTFICIKIAGDHPDRSRIASLYNKKEGSFGSLFISSDGILLHNYPGSTTFVKTYEEQIDKALTKAGEGMRVNELEKMYAEGNKTPGIMELLMQTKQALRLETDGLLDEYVSLLPADSFNSVRTLQFIASMAPVLDSKADVKFRLSPSFNKSWYAMSLPLRISTNNRIGYKSMQKAIREKNERFAFRVAAFMKGTYTNNSSLAALQAYDSKIMDYFREINDTLNYLIRALNYYDNYYMKVSVDSIKKKDSTNMKYLFAKKDTSMNMKTAVGETKTIRHTIMYSPIVQTYSRELNNAALSFYELSNEPLNLLKALQWSARANEFNESPEAMDTHAHLLYKLGRKKEAIEWQNKAITLKKKRGFDTKDFEKRLSAMK
jgi:tetratricopeptide (TPR) repeat protein